jgi:hypothetical protein
MKKVLTLTWDNMPHTFVIQWIRGVLRGVLTIRKPKGTQTIRVRFPSGVSIKMIQDAWKKQRHKWRPFVKVPRFFSAFVAIRRIRLPKHLILWYVVHRKDVPYDAVSVLPF